jgi:4-hydroxyphenylpyruvate dioxygenase-like putative hemolysin
MPTEVLPLRRIDHVRFFVGNARQSACFYRSAFGFDVVAYAGLETRSRHEAGYVLRQGEITFVLASPLSKDHPESGRLLLHGDGVQDIALQVDDVRTAYQETPNRLVSLPLATSHKWMKPFASPTAKVLCRTTRQSHRVLRAC